MPGLVGPTSLQALLALGALVGRFGGQGYPTSPLPPQWIERYIIDQGTIPDRPNGFLTSDASIRVNTRPAGPLCASIFQK